MWLFTVDVIQAHGRMCGSGRRWLHDHGMDKLYVMAIEGDFTDFINAPAYREEVNMRLDDGDKYTIKEAYCGTASAPLPEAAHLGIGALEHGSGGRPVSLKYAESDSSCYKL